MKQNCKVVMLPTEKASVIGIGSTLMSTHNYNLAYAEKPFKVNSIKSQHLYIISDEEIKKGDWFIDFSVIKTGNIGRCSRAISDDLKNSKNCFKITATTDTSLNLLIIPNDFIKLYVESYNNGNIIEDVVVELIGTITKEGITESYDIKLPKQSFTREEVIEILTSGQGEGMKEQLIRWFNSNY